MKPNSLGAAASLFALTSFGSPAAMAQNAPTLQEITVTGNPLGATEMIAPATGLAGTNLLLRSQSTLGETLNGLPGVSSTYFGPNASRPVIRGLDGDRIRVLQNSGASIDASALSFDHAVPMDPISVDRVEVLRGPGALLYGGSAVGGVVNVLDHRIPREALFDAAGGVSGRANASAASGNREGAAALSLESGNQRFALHADVFSRDTGDVRAPRLLACEQGGGMTLRRRICNSRSDTHGGALGGSVFFDHGYLGASVARFESDYGTVAEDEVTIGMRSTRYALEGEKRNLDGLITAVKGQFSHTNYRHTEFEAGAPGTLFANQGNDYRFEARHRQWGALEGVWGLQGETTRFSADGAEAFAPFSRTRQDALFAYEELGTRWGKLSFGARVESVRVKSLGNPDPTVTRFTPGERDFTPASYSMGSLVNLAPTWQLTGNLAVTQRAPKDYELFANGLHIATAAFETGDANLKKERSASLDIGAAWKSGPHKLTVNAYASRFRNYIALTRTANSFGADGEPNPVDADADGVADGSGEDIFAEFAYRGVRARFVGLEASGVVRLQGPGGWQPSAGYSLDWEWRADVVRATNRDTGEPLPRIAPLRLGSTLVWTQGPWSVRGGVDYAAAQNRVPSGDRATGDHALFNLAATWRMQAGVRDATLLWFAKLDNLTNQLAYSATSILTTTAFPKAPLPGRSLKVGVQANF